MAEFKSWHSFNDFERSTKRNCRYIYDKTIQEFLEIVLDTSKKRKRQIKKGSILWRSQLGNDLKPVFHDNEHVLDDPYPLKPERMKPIPNMANEGRANPKGIPYLYLATDKETAMAESRPWLGSHISVGQFKINQDIAVVDCSLLHNKNNYFFMEEPSAEEKEKAVWSYIDSAFSEPVTGSDNTADYVPTQILAELFKSNGFDGLVYKSNLEKGHNIVLFNIERADMVNCYLFKTEKIKFSFTESFEQYHLRKKNH